MKNRFVAVFWRYQKLGFFDDFETAEDCMNFLRASMDDGEIATQCFVVDTEEKTVRASEPLFSNEDPFEDIPKVKALVGIPDLQILPDTFSREFDES